MRIPHSPGDSVESQWMRLTSSTKKHYCNSRQKEKLVKQKGNGQQELCKVERSLRQSYPNARICNKNILY